MHTIKVLWQDVLNKKSSVVVNTVDLIEKEEQHTKLDVKQRFYFNSNEISIYLTFREMQVFRLSFNDMKNHEISRLTHLSVRTVEYYLSHVRRKFKCRRIVHAVNLIKTDASLWLDYLSNEEVLIYNSYFNETHP